MKSTLSAIALLAMTSAHAIAGGTPMSFDVAEDMSRFVFASAPVFDDGMPAYGNAFITQGYIYEDGTLDSGVEGTLPDGSPAFPDKVIGRWTCDGYFVGDGMRTQTGAVVITRQVFEFNNGDILINQGTELVDVNVRAPRVITGGTGAFEGMSGEMTQVLLGMSEGYGVRLLIDVKPEEHAALAPVSSD
ncbi:hypothetical protein MUY21_07825 [Aliiroseovarius sp. S2029]|uniref:hypothetical protein n=1 Tax=Aliiroseovarius sp. S2029 TaxID=2936988 RepID=UPI0020BFB4F7|nr:hypothetical protein [Aliiroseovarius sp. S2029]MCK8483942.1 hypothetical protein [Aliiroseovarius sp. S2029]